MTDNIPRYNVLRYNEIINHLGITDWIKFSELGDHLKSLENSYLSDTYTASDNKSLVCRLDGRSFHSFTSNLSKPFDTDLQRCFTETCEDLMSFFNCSAIYTQSDEITCHWNSLDKVDFGGRKIKLLSILASATSVIFYKKILKYLPQNAYKNPHFDARLFYIDKKDLYAPYTWRLLDCIKNSVNMVVHNIFSLSELKGKSCNERLKMLDEYVKIPNYYFNNFTQEQQYGTFFIKKMHTFKINDKYLKFHTNQGNEMTRKRIVKVDWKEALTHIMENVEN